VVYTIIYALLAIPGWVMMWVMMWDARLFWPVTQGGAFVKLQEMLSSTSKTDFSEFLPIFSPVDDRTHPINTAWITLAALAVIALCYGLMLFQRRLREDAPKHMRYSAQGGMWAITLFVVGLGWYFINFDYLKHRTEVVQLNRWIMPMQLDEPYGIAYYDDKIYISTYARNSYSIVGAFDIKSQVFTVIKPTMDSTEVAFSHVGDIKMGPDGDFYVLNNGDLSNAMWVMKPDGEIVEGLSLEAKTPIATGLNFGPDGNIYISDMLGGRILKFQPTGGTPLGVYGGMTGGFNNPAGVAVTPDGMIYAAEQGFARLQQLAPDGTFIRNIDLHCKPTHVTVSGDFLDISCDKGLVGVNWKKGEVQLVHYASLDQKPINPTGLTYGPDNHLFVLDGNTLIEYQVTH
jgi:hypothetical protein